MATGIVYKEKPMHEGVGLLLGVMQTAASGKGSVRNVDRSKLKTIAQHLQLF